METKHKEHKNAVAAESTPDAAAQSPSQPPPAPTQPTQTEIEELTRQAAKAAENWDRFVRVTADLENFKKRAARERTEAATFANEALLSKLIPVMDTLEKAIAAAEADPAAQSIRAGVVMVAGQLKSALAEAGLEEIDATGQKFDPNCHEALSQQDSADVPDGGVLQQVRKGYKYRNRLLRPAGVIVARKPVR